MRLTTAFNAQKRKYCPKQYSDRNDLRRNSKTLRYTAKRYQVPGSRDTTASECQRRWLVRTSNRSYVFAGLPPHRSYRSRSAADCGTAVVGLGCSLYFLIANNQWVSLVVPIKIVLLHICVVSMYRALYVRTFHECLSVLALPPYLGSSRRFIHSLRLPHLLEYASDISDTMFAFQLPGTTYRTQSQSGCWLKVSANGVD